MSFDEDKNRQIEYYKQEFTSILEGNVEELIEKNSYIPQEGEEAGVYEHLSNVILGNFEPESGFILNHDYDCKLFEDDVSYVRFHRGFGGPGIDYIIGSNGDAILKYSWGGLHLDDIRGSHEHSALFEIAEMIYGEKFTNNYFEMDDEEILLRNKISLGVESFEEFITDNADPKGAPVLSFEEFVDCLKETEFNALDATKKALEEGWFNCYDAFTLESYTAEDLKGDIENHIKTFEKLSLNSDFEDVCSAFGIDADKLTEIDFDDLEDEFEAAFNPEVEVKVKNKVSPKP